MSEDNYDALLRRAVRVLWESRQFSTADIADLLVESEARIVQVLTTDGVGGGGMAIGEGPVARISGGGGGA